VLTGAKGGLEECGAQGIGPPKNAA